MKIKYLLTFIVLSVFVFLPKNTFALQFLDGTSFYDQKSPTSNTWTRSKYPAPDCTRTYCQFIASSGLNSTTDYYAFEANVNNDFVKQKSDKFSFDYKIGLTYSTPSIQPNFTLDPTTAIVHIAPLGVDTQSTCTTNYSDVTSEGATVSGHCVIEYEVGYSSFSKFFMSWRSKDMQSSPSSFPVLTYNPNKAIYITFTTATTLTNFKFSSSGETDLSGIEQEIDEVNKNINETNKKLDETNKNLDKIDKTLNDDDTSVAEDKASNFFNDFEDNNHGLSGVVTAPLEFIQALTSAKCEPLKFKLPMVHNEVTLPCMKAIYKEHFGVFFTLWQLLTTGLISYNVCLNIYKKVRDLQNPNNDRIEVLNL